MAGLEDVRALNGRNGGLLRESEKHDNEISSSTTPKRRRMWAYHAKTLLLFTKSDFKTVILPQTIFAMMALLSPAKLTVTAAARAAAAAESIASSTEATEGSTVGSVLEVSRRLPHMFAWVWLHLLVENIANQRSPDAIAEDLINKPWRPLPSKRLSQEEARDWLRYALIVAVGCAHFWLGGLDASLALVAMIWMYNDLGGSSCGVFIRNGLNAGGLMCFSWGALSVLSGDGSLNSAVDGSTVAVGGDSLYGGNGELLPMARTWILVTGGIIMTTVHYQDLPDRDGDEARGRLTAPLVYGETPTRWSLAVMVAFWSVAAPLLWNSTDLARWGPLQALVLLVGAAIAWIAVMRWGQAWDEAGWKLWCLWIAAIYALPTTSVSA